MTATRRAFLASAVAVAATGVVRVPRSAARAAAPQPVIAPRSAWGGDLAPRGPLAQEQPGDVRFLLVHHSETPNGYGPEKVVPRLRNIFEYHTGTKGWPDIAYNFFVDAHGRIWEGRTGSLTAPVQGDATGGSQGHAMLCCFLGDHSAVPPTPEAVAAMAQLTAWLAGVYRVDLSAGPTIAFTSRGSNRWPAGTTVLTDPIAGHRDMSQTACPGDAAYPLVRGAILQQAQAIAGVGSTTTTASTTTTPPTVTSTTVAATTTATTTASTADAAPMGSAPEATTGAASGEAGSAPAGDGGSGDAHLAVAGATGAAAVGAAAVWAVRRRSQRGAEERALDADEQRQDPSGDGPA